jgi:hypothetical protein
MQMRISFLVAFLVLGVTSAVAQERSVAPPTSRVILWGHARDLDAQGRVLVGSDFAPLWGVELLRGKTCRSEVAGGATEPCEAVAIRHMREIFVGSFGRWLVIKSNECPSGATLFSELTEFLVSNGWLLDVPSCSDGYYTEDMRLARLKKVGIWGLVID